MADTGWLNYVNFETIAWGGSGSWYLPSRAQEGDLSFTYEIVQAGTDTDYLHAYEIDFDGTPLASGCTITGIAVRVLRKSGSTPNSIKDNGDGIWLAQAGSHIGDDAGTGTYWPTALTEKVYGGPGDMWGTTLDQADVEDADFGFLFGGHTYEYSTQYAYVDHIQIKLYYTPPPIIEPDPIVSGEAFGSATLTKMLTIVEPDPIASGEDFGAHYVIRSGDIITDPIPSTATFATAVITREYIPKPFDILRINEIRVQVSMLEKDDSGSVACTLVERTNELLYSEQLQQAGSWTVSNLTVSADATTDPAGTGLAEKLVEASDTAQDHKITQTCATLTTDADCTFSVHLKGAERMYAVIEVVNKAGTSFYGDCDLDIDNPAITTDEGCTVRVENYGDGWARYIMIVDIGTGGTTPSLAIHLAEADEDVTYDGDGASGLYAWGAQVEEAADTIDYIPTTTIAVAADVSTPVWFNVAFIDVFAITMAVSSEVFASAIYILRDVPFPWGFKIRVFDENGDRIAKTVSWVAKGV